MKYSLLFLVLIFLGCSNIDEKPASVALIVDDPGQKVDIYLSDQLFTSYRFGNDLKKPVLWPVTSPAGNEVTRSYPVKVKTGERADHPHHLGVWLNYGNVNGLDFWNNSDAVPPEKAAHYGRIRHLEIQQIESGGEQGLLETTAQWVDHQGRVLLNELTQYRFKAIDNGRLIDRTTTLTAVADTVNFTDNKEGMFAIRVCRELELPEENAVKLVSGGGQIIEVDAPDNSLVSGNYLSSEGVSGGAVWGTRAEWMKLSGIVNGEPVALVIFDHPDNIGYPTYWHARRYGLFSANPLGQSVFSKGEKVLNFSLEKGASVTFTYRLAIFSGDPTVPEIETLAQNFQNQ